jgi:hypothetical protein
MSEKQPKSTPAEAPASSAASEGFFGSAEDMINREAELNAEAYRNRLRDEALAGIDEYLEENPDMSREEAMQQIVSDLEAYDAKLGDMHKAGDAYGNLEHTIDQTDAGERLDAVDRTIDSDPILRRMNMLAKAVAELRASEATPENLQAIQDKEDKLAELLDKYEDTGEANYDAVDRIFNRTVDGVEAEPQVHHKDQTETSSSRAAEVSNEPSKEAQGEQEDTDVDKDKKRKAIAKEMGFKAIDEVSKEESDNKKEAERINRVSRIAFEAMDEVEKEINEAKSDGKDAAKRSEDEDRQVKEILREPKFNKEIAKRAEELRKRMEEGEAKPSEGVMKRIKRTITGYFMRRELRKQERNKTASSKDANNKTASKKVTKPVSVKTNERGVPLPGQAKQGAERPSDQNE